MLCANKYKYNYVITNGGRCFAVSASFSFSLLSAENETNLVIILPCLIKPTRFMFSFQKSIELSITLLRVSSHAKEESSRDLRMTRISCISRLLLLYVLSTTTYAHNYRVALRVASIRSIASSALSPTHRVRCHDG